MVDEPDATIHIRVPAITKARWVRESRAKGLRLGDWITQAVEAQHPDIAQPQDEQDEPPTIRRNHTRP